ncbi:MAG: twin-arginine translocase TatA/TatE family subunit [Verrucomicrobiota bacterium]
MQLTMAFITSPQDWTMILLIVLLLFGAKKLPELARGVGKSMGEFKRAKDDFENQITKAATELPAEKTPHDKA